MKIQYFLVWTIVETINDDNLWWRNDIKMKFSQIVHNINKIIVNKIYDELWRQIFIMVPYFISFQLFVNFGTL